MLLTDNGVRWRQGTIISVGDELLRGDLVNTNATWLAQRLFQLGVEVTSIDCVGDDLEPLVARLEQAMSRRSLIVVTGGLGPTDDDRTAESVARAAGLTLERDEPVLQALRQRFEQTGWPFTSNNEKQAFLPRGASWIPNRKGTAAGFALQAGQAQIVCMPGVPWEMKVMFDEGVVPLLQGEGLRPARVRVLHVFGMGESQIDARLQGLLLTLQQAGLELSLHYRTSFPLNDVILVCRGEEQQAMQMLDRFEAEVRQRLGPLEVFGVDHTSFGDAVVQALRRAGATVALAESCTGGLAGDLITSASGSSEVFQLGVVTYSNAFKHQMLDVPWDILDNQGAVSRECVIAMARGVRRVAGATYGVAISGVAGPTGGTPDKPVGTVHFALAHEGGERHVVRRFPWVDDRRRIKAISAHVALALVLRHVSGLAPLADPFDGRWSPTVRGDDEYDPSVPGGEPADLDDREDPCAAG